MTEPAGFRIRSAAELADPELEARWAGRRRGRQDGLFRSVLRAFAEGGGPVGIAELQRALPGWTPGRLREGLAALDQADLLHLDADRVRLIYPFSADPTPFVVELAGGGRRHACCAIDALGIAALLGAPIVIHARCHHCGEPLRLEADAAGPVGAGEVLVWVGRHRGDQRRVSASL